MERPSLLHLRFSKTSSMGMFSCIHIAKLHKTPSTPKSNKTKQILQNNQEKKRNKKHKSSAIRSITKSTTSFNTASRTSGFSFSPIFQSLSLTAFQYLQFSLSLSLTNYRSQSIKEDHKSNRNLQHSEKSKTTQ